MIILTMFYLLFERAAYLAFCVCSTENYGKGEPQPQSLLVPPAFRDSAKNHGIVYLLQNSTFPW